MTSSEVDLVEYRACVDDVVERAVVQQLFANPEAILDLLTEVPAITGVLRHHPDGIEHALRGLRRELVEYVPNTRSSARDLSALTRVYLLHQIDVLWWGTARRYATSADVVAAPDLVDLEPLLRSRRLRFRYTRQPTTLVARVAPAARRRLLPHVAPPSAGLRYTRARPEAVAFLNQVADELAAQCGHRRACVWLNSAARSEVHQEHLRRLGYSAMNSSSHCSGYAMDIAIDWLHRWGCDVILKRILTDHRDTEEINVIDEGQAWHVCLGPASLAGLRASYDAEFGG